MTFRDFGFTQNGEHERMMAYAALHTAFTDALEVSSVSPWFAKCTADIEFLIHVQDLVMDLVLMNLHEHSIW